MQTFRGPREGGNRDPKGTDSKWSQGRVRCMQRMLVLLEQAQEKEPNEEALWEKSERG